MSEELFIGLMSGTSIDGIDAALVAFESAGQLRVIDTLFTPFDKNIRAEISYTAQNNQSLFSNQDSPLHQKLAPIYASACIRLLAKAKVLSDKVSGIANHGQTVKHEPDASPSYSLQLGDGQTLADLTGIKTYTQFRQADLAAGGQGAPLMPAFHKALFTHNTLDSLDNSLILNIGGIANITCLRDPIVGFDTGPGNVLLDQWIEQHLGLHFDQSGQWAKQGRVNTALLNKLSADHYFAESYPKSTGTDYFNLAWLSNRYPFLSNLAPEDVQATLVQLTVNSISDSILGLSGSPEAVFVCGGGANNPMIMHGLQTRLSDYDVKTTDVLGVPSDWVEAVGFAWLGYCRAHDIASNIASVTGAKSEVVLGEVFLPR